MRTEREPCRVRGKGLNANQPFNKTHAQTNKRRNDEQQQKRLSGNGGTKSSNPSHSGVNQGGNGIEDISHESTPLDLDQSLNETDTETDKGHDHKGQDKRIGGNGTDKGADPLHSFGYQSGNIGYNGRDGHSGSRILQNTPFQKKLC